MIAFGAAIAGELPGELNPFHDILDSCTNVVFWSLCGFLGQPVQQYQCHF